MEELTPNWDGTFEQSEGVLIDNYIDGVLDEQLRLLLMTAPITILPVTEVSGQHTATRRNDGSGRITLIDNVMRPVSLQIKGWKVPVTRFIDERHPLYELQFNRYTRGGTTKPVATFTLDGLGNKIIDYFSLPSSSTTHHIMSLQCILTPDDNATTYDLNPQLIDTLCRQCASAVYDIMGNRAMADVMLSHIAI